MLTDYCGATLRHTIDQALELDPRRFAFSPKIDGCYARITTDSRGRIVRVMSRAAADISQARDLIGIVAGPPDAVLHGELEAHTEAGNRIAACRGWRNLHLFDCTRSHGRSIERLPYSERYGELHRAHAAIELAGAGRTSYQDEHGRTHHKVSGDFRTHAPRDLRRVPVVPLHRGPSAAERLWRSHVEVGGGEGIVAIALDAPAGRRGSKRKVKATDTIDCTVVAVDSSAASLVYAGRVFHISARGKLRPVVGQVLEVAHDGFYENASTPRFARIVRARPDLSERTSTPA